MAATANVDTPGFDIEARLVQARLALVDKDYARASRLTRGVLREDQNHAGGLLLLGMLDYLRGDYARSVAAFERALATGVQPGVLLIKAAVERELGDVERARETCRAAVAENPQAVLGWFLLGELCEQAGDDQAAIDAFEQVVALSPVIFPAHAKLARLLARHGHMAKAREHVEISLRRRIAVAEERLGLGDLELQAGRRERAVAELCNAYRYESEPGERHYRTACAVHDRGLLDEAEASYHQAIATGTEVASCHHRLGRIAFTRGDSRAAIRAYRTSLRLADRVGEVWVDMGHAYRALGLLDKARRSLRIALEIDATLLDARNLLEEM